MTLGAIQNIHSAHTRTSIEFKKIGKGNELQRFEVTKVDDDGILADMWDYVIVSWTGFTDEREENVPCTKEMKAELMRGCPEFYKFVDVKQAELSADLEAYLEEREKNS